MQQFSF